MIAIGVTIVIIAIVSLYCAYYCLDGMGRDRKPTQYEQWEEDYGKDAKNAYEDEL